MGDKREKKKKNEVLGTRQLPMWVDGARCMSVLHSHAANLNPRANLAQAGWSAVSLCSDGAERVKLFFAFLPSYWPNTSSQIRLPTVGKPGQRMDKKIETH